MPIPLFRDLLQVRRERFRQDRQARAHFRERGTACMKLESGDYNEKGGNNMKKVLLAIALVCFVVLPSAGFSANQSNTGCGLGSIVMQGNDGLLFQVLAVTTNGTFGNQTFGISSGTLNCSKPGRFASRERVGTYIADNMDSLANDIARGNGEYLSTLAVLMDVPEASRAGFYGKLQGNFKQIYPSAAVTSSDVLKNIEGIM